MELRAVVITILAALMQSAISQDNPPSSDPGRKAGLPDNTVKYEYNPAEERPPRPQLQEVLPRSQEGVSMGVEPRLLNTLSFGLLGADSRQEQPVGVQQQQQPQQSMPPPSGPIQPVQQPWPQQPQQQIYIQQIPYYRKLQIQACICWGDSAQADRDCFCYPEDEGQNVNFCLRGQIVESLALFNPSPNKMAFCVPLTNPQQVNNGGMQTQPGRPMF